MIPIFLTFLDTRILASHFAETATWRHPVPSPWHPPATHRNSRSRYAMAKADRDLMPSTGIMNPSHTVETKVREEASGSDPLRALKNFLAPRPSLSLPHCLNTFQSLGEARKTCLTQGPHDGQTLCWSVLMGPQQFQELRRPGVGRQVGIEQSTRSTPKARQKESCQLGEGQAEGQWNTMGVIRSMGSGIRLWPSSTLATY